MKCACAMTLDEIKCGHFDRLKSRRVVIIEDLGHGWRIHEWTEASVSPTYDVITIQAALDTAEGIAVRHRREPSQSLDEGGEVITDPTEIAKALKR